jgi:enamine deaminase RidA (YjgF/YER057c/UK114 family)
MVAVASATSFGSCCSLLFVSFLCNPACYGTSRRELFNISKETTMQIPARREFFGKLAALGGLAALIATPATAQTASKRFIKRDGPDRSGYSPAVITEGGKTIWLAGMTGAVDASGKSLAGDFDAQVRATFAVIEQTVKEAGGKLSDLVTMTVFLTDPRNHRRMTEIRREILGKDFPASASISISHLANPNALLEIQAVAVIS